MLAEKKMQLYYFADWYLSLFQGKLDASHFRDFENIKFGRECERFGFKMDCGESIEHQFPRASYDAKALKEAIRHITDIELIGSAIYSRWRYYTHWAMAGESYLDEESREWFTIAFSHLLQLASFYAFRGKVEKIVIESKKMDLFPPAPGQEVKQRLTLYTNGNVTLTRYFSGDGSQIPTTKNTKTTNRYKGKHTEKMMNYLAEFFRNLHDEERNHTSGRWRIALTNTNGEKWSFVGSFSNNIKVGELSLSAITRMSLEMPELWVFDGEVGNVNIAPKTIDDYTKEMDYPSMVLLGETKHFRFYREKTIEDGDTGLPVFVVENKLNNTFDQCDADSAYPIMGHFSGGGESENDVENSIIYNALKRETIPHHSMKVDIDDLLEGIERPSPVCCENCIHSDGDSPFNDGADKVQCMMYYNQFDFKPFEVMFKRAACEYWESID